jgi:hypothetical protein
VHTFLEEHQKQGLPSLEATVHFLHSLGGRTIEIPNGLIWRWMLVMGITMFLQKDPSDPELMQKIHSFMNRNLAPLDNQEPAYRHIIVCSRVPLPDDVRMQIQRLETPGEAFEKDAVMSWEGATAALQTMIADKIRQRDEEINQLQGQIRILEEFRDQVQRSLPYRLYRQWKQLWKQH